MYQDLQKYWIFTHEQLEEIHSMRNEAYTYIVANCPEFNDRILQNMDIHNLIKLMRNYKIQNSPLVLLDKMIETAVTLLKRYSLIKSYGEGSRAQVVMCAIYLAMKIEESGDKWLSGFAEKIINRKKIDACHYSQHGYTEHEMSFLMTINFEIKHLSAIRPYEGLMERIKESRADIDMTYLLTVQKQFFQLLEATYYHDDIFFTTHPAKIALSIVLNLLDAKSLSVDIIDRGGDIKRLIEENIKQIDALRTKLTQIAEQKQKFNAKAETQRYKSFKGMLRQEFKKPVNLKRSSTAGLNTPNQNSKA